MYRSSIASAERSRTTYHVVNQFLEEVRTASVGEAAVGSVFTRSTPPPRSEGRSCSVEAPVLPWFSDRKGIWISYSSGQTVRSCGR